MKRPSQAMKEGRGGIMRGFVLSMVLAATVSMSFANAPELVDYADPLVGTDNSREVSNGNLYPAIVRPWGMNAWTPQTRPAGTPWIYDYKDMTMCGFHQTHQPSPWIGDYAQFSVMPTVGRVVFAESDRASRFSHKTEAATPASYRVYLADFDTTVELTTTERAAILRLTYPETDAARFVVDALDMGSEIAVDRANRRIVGTSRKIAARWNEDAAEVQKVDCNFLVEFDHPFAAVHDATKGDHAVVAVTFPPMKRGEQVNVRVAASFIDAEQAMRNLQELGNRDFDAVLEESRSVWNEALGRIHVEGGKDGDFRKFYTCLYRSLLFPRRFHEYDASGMPVHRNLYGPGVRHGRYGCDVGFWDAFRALFPLLKLVYPERVTEAMEGLLHVYEESGWIPEWAAPYHRDCMIGQNSAAVIADAYVSGLMDRATALKLYEGLVKATCATGRVASVGRVGYEEYNRLGYIPMDGETDGQSASRTIEYAFADWCVWRLGTALGRPQAETDVFLKRSGNWRNVFHPGHKLMCGRHADGSWDRDFNIYRWGFAFTEGTPLHYTWSVFHDIPGLIEAMGGKDAFEARLDSVFALPPKFDGSFWKEGCTHEIREMQIAGFGQYAHGNQPVQHAVYLYDLIGRREKAAHWAHEVMNRLYRATPDGYCGDEDNGQASAWFVWSAMGRYPVLPVGDSYAVGKPLFDKVEIRRPQECAVIFDNQKEKGSKQ